MNNEEKILAILQQLQQGQADTNARLDKMEARLDSVEARLDKMQAQIDKIQAQIDKMQAQIDKVQIQINGMCEDIAEIREHAEVTRGATNSLVQWAETVGVLTQVGFPLRKTVQ